MGVGMVRVRVTATSTWSSSAVVVVVSEEEQSGEDSRDGLALLPAAKGAKSTTLPPPCRRTNSRRGRQKKKKKKKTKRRTQRKFYEREGITVRNKKSWQGCGCCVAYLRDGSSFSEQRTPHPFLNSIKKRHAAAAAALWLQTDGSRSVNQGQFVGQQLEEGIQPTVQESINQS